MRRQGEKNNRVEVRREGERQGGRENKKSGQQHPSSLVGTQDTDVEIQITHTPANHRAHQGGEDERRWGERAVGGVRKGQR